MELGARALRNSAIDLSTQWGKNKSDVTSQPCSSSTVRGIELLEYDYFAIAEESRMQAKKLRVQHYSVMIAKRQKGDMHECYIVQLSQGLLSPLCDSISVS